MTTLGARPQLSIVASYATAAGPLTGEVLAQGELTGVANSFAFRLPNRLQRVPTGDVCLRIVDRQNRPVPVRVPSPGSASDGFRYAAWERAAIANSRLPFLEDRNEMIATELERYDRARTEFDRWRLEANITQVSDCENLTAGAGSTYVELDLRGMTVAQAATQQCVHQFGWLARSIRRTPTDLALEIGRAMGTTMTGSLKSEFDQMVESTQAYRSAYEPGFRPLLPFNQSTGLPLSSSSVDPVFTERRLGKGASTGVINAFSRCVIDARQLIETRNMSSQRQQRPDLVETESSASQTLCRQRFAEDSVRAEQQAALLAELAETKTEQTESKQAIVLSDREIIPLAGTACAQ